MQDFDDWADPDLYLPVRGHRIRVASPTARDGLRLRRLLLDTDALTPERERVEVRRILGDAVGEIDALGGDATVVALVGRTALLHFGQSPAAAQALWNGDLGDAPAAAPADPAAPGHLGPDDPGGGPIDSATGMRWWYNPPEMAPRPPGSTDAPVMSWADVLACWPAIELDLHQHFGVDVDSGVLDERPWRWLEQRIRALASTPGTRLHRAVFPRPKTP
ncbi:hypothetical protein IU433_14015 [Nocardia puris]|uniref:DUF7426 family protein n=1 Tax=Nocardia puris TaxID=208602 RepID=UPI00189635B8|nr:hypothetical protein [Nocardia puris]MBF6460152.1 hypothetical protein [Nocardia puris]